MLDSLNAMINDTGLFFPDTGDVVAVATWADDLHGRFDTSLFASWHFANLVRRNAAVCARSCVVCAWRRCAWLTKRTCECESFSRL